MLKPAVQVRDEGGFMTAEFWDCLRLDPAPIQELRKLFETHVRRGGRADLVIDLNGVGFAGSAALGGFLAIHRDARQRGGRLIFCNVDPTVREVFRVSKIEPLFTFVVDKPAALALAARDPDSAGSPDSPAAPPPTRSDPSSRPSPLRGRRRKEE
jgi:anti-anti-sigma factor